ncbi:hypothetical protein DFH06DRAFT_1160846 [Mycena polygramma]|nr:hypothetical protein DFH06DRAFT_1160846 [Mycena polygramma]
MPHFEPKFVVISSKLILGESAVTSFFTVQSEGGENDGIHFETWQKADQTVQSEKTNAVSAPLWFQTNRVDVKNVTLSKSFLQIIPGGFAFFVKESFEDLGKFTGFALHFLELVETLIAHSSLLNDMKSNLSDLFDIIIVHTLIACSIEEDVCIIIDDGLGLLQKQRPAEITLDGCDLDADVSFRQRRGILDHIRATRRLSSLRSLGARRFHKLGKIRFVENRRRHLGS